MPNTFKRIDISKPSWQWSQRDWAVFRASRHPTMAHERLVPRIDAGGADYRGLWLEDEFERDGCEG